MSGPQVGVSYFCNKGQLGENEAVGNRTDMFSQETLRAIMRTVEEKDPVQAETLKHTMEGAKCGLSHMLGTHVSSLTSRDSSSKTFCVSTAKLLLHVLSYCCYAQNVTAGNVHVGIAPPLMKQQLLARQSQTMQSDKSILRMRLAIAFSLGPTTASG